jgi:hypothetical protein
VLFFDLNIYLRKVIISLKLRTRISKAFQADVDKLPVSLRKLLYDELAAGNEIVEVGHSFPAPPMGAYFKLGHSVSTRLHESGGGLDFYDRNTPYYSDEFTDVKRFFFILEPPHKQLLSPEMGAIRNVHSSANFVQMKDNPMKEYMQSDNVTDVQNSLVDRFKKSMVIDYEKWHDGIGYDLKLLNEATLEELDAIVNLLVAKEPLDWRDVEALAALGTPRANRALKAAVKGGNSEVQMSVLRYAPETVDKEMRTKLMVQALRSTVLYHGLSQALDEVESYHPPEVVHELLRGLLEREGEVAVLFAAMLFFIHGKADAAFNMKQRPFFLQFNTDVVAERRKVFRELCKVIGVNPEEFIRLRDSELDP